MGSSSSNWLKIGVASAAAILTSGASTALTGAAWGGAASTAAGNAAAQNAATMAALSGGFSGYKAPTLEQAAGAGATVGAAGPIGGAMLAAQGTDLSTSPGQTGMTTQTRTPQDTASATSAATSQQLSQQLAASAGGTLFATPRQWWGEKIGNAQGGKVLVGA